MPRAPQSSPEQPRAKLAFPDDVSAANDLKRMREILENENSAKRQRTSQMGGENVQVPSYSSGAFIPNNNFTNHPGRNNNAQYNAPSHPYAPPENFSNRPNVNCGGGYNVSAGANAVQPFRDNHNGGDDVQKCPRLREDESLLLNRHYGCRECRLFYVQH